MNLALSGDVQSLTAQADAYLDGDDVLEFKYDIEDALSVQEDLVPLEEVGMTHEPDERVREHSVAGLDSLTGVDVFIDRNGVNKFCVEA